MVGARACPPSLCSLSAALSRPPRTTTVVDIYERAAVRAHGTWFSVGAMHAFNVCGYTRRRGQDFSPSPSSLPDSHSLSLSPPRSPVQITREREREEERAAEARRGGRRFPTTPLHYYTHRHSLSVKDGHTRLSLSLYLVAISSAAPQHTPTGAHSLPSSLVYKGKERESARPPKETTETLQAQTHRHTHKTCLSVCV